MSNLKIPRRARPLIAKKKHTLSRSRDPEKTLFFSKKRLNFHLLNDIFDYVSIKIEREKKSNCVNVC